MRALLFEVVPAWTVLQEVGQLLSSYNQLFTTHTDFQVFPST